jgi:hypothetical protein
MTDKPVLSPWLGSYLGYPKTEQQKSVGATYWYGGGQGGKPEGSCLDAREYQWLEPKTETISRSYRVGRWTKSNLEAKTTYSFSKYILGIKWINCGAN